MLDWITVLPIEPALDATVRHGSDRLPYYYGLAILYGWNVYKWNRNKQHGRRRDAKDREQDARLDALEGKSTHMGYVQTDARWYGTRLGESAYTMGGFGCLTTAHAQAFKLAGWDISPKQVVDAFNTKSVYTDRHYLESKPGAGDGQPGLLLWSRVSKAFPQYQVSIGSYERHYKFYQVLTVRRTEHWLLQVDGVWYDPIDGSETAGELPKKYRFTGSVRSADIESPPMPGQVTEPVMVNILFDKPRYVEITADPFLWNHTSPDSKEETRVPDDQENPDPAKRTYGKLTGTIKVVGYVHAEIIDQGLPTENDKWYLTTKGNYFSARHTNKPNL